MNIQHYYASSCHRVMNITQILIFTSRDKHTLRGQLNAPTQIKKEPLGHATTHELKPSTLLVKSLKKTLVWRGQHKINKRIVTNEALKDAYYIFLLQIAIQKVNVLQIK